jgi:hypothetical protein
VKRSTSLDVTCDECGARVGERCTGGQSHNARVEAWQVRQRASWHAERPSWCTCPGDGTICEEHRRVGHAGIADARRILAELAARRGGS